MFLRRSRYGRRALCALLLCLLGASAAAADTLMLSNGHIPSSIDLRPYLRVWEERGANASPAAVLQRPALFAPLDSCSPGAPTSVYWLQMPLRAESAKTEWVLRFSHLTYVDVYLMRGDSCLAHRAAGAFRPRSELSAGDSRFAVTLSLVPRGPHTLLVRVHHSKGYQPHFDFSLYPKEVYVQETHRRERADAGMQGAVALFFLYTALSWAVSRYRPYAWLLLFIGGVGGYGLCSGPYFVDWFFPERPATGWLFNGPFLHLGLLGLYLLVIDFWQLPRNHPTLYRYGQVCVAVLVTLSVGGFLINATTGNFNGVNTLNLWAFAFPFTFTLALLVRCYRYLDRAQKYLYWGIVLFLLGGVFITGSSALLHERSLHLAPYVTHATTLGVFLIFTTGLKEALRQHERDKWAVLQELTRLQGEQNTLLEQKVEARTGELRRSNDLLAQRNRTIETLMNELSHRVKNNLQLLYSLSSLQLPGVRNEATIQLLKGTMARIKAMMLVNQQLDATSEKHSVSLAALTGELTGHLQAIYDRGQRVAIRCDIPQEWELPSHQALSLGLILTELLTNSFKYAFEQTLHPLIRIAAHRTDAGLLQLV